MAAGKCNIDDRYVLQEIWYNIGCAYHELGMVDMAKSCYIRSIMARESSDRIKVDDFLVFLKDDYPFPLITGIARMAAINLRKLLLSSSNNAELVMKLSQRILTF